MADITAVGKILIDLTQSGGNELGIPVFAANPVIPTWGWVFGE